MQIHMHFSTYIGELHLEIKDGLRASIVEALDQLSVLNSLGKFRYKEFRHLLSVAVWSGHGESTIQWQVGSQLRRQLSQRFLKLLKT